MVLIFSHILVLREYWVLTEGRMPFGLVMGVVGVVALSIGSREQTQ